MVFLTFPGPCQSSRPFQGPWVNLANSILIPDLPNPWELCCCHGLWMVAMENHSTTCCHGLCMVAIVNHHPTAHSHCLCVVAIVNHQPTTCCHGLWMVAMVNCPSTNVTMAYEWLLWKITPLPIPVVCVWLLWKIITPLPVATARYHCLLSMITPPYYVAMVYAWLLW